MALANTTLSAAITATSKSLVVASATSMAAARVLRIDDELMVVSNDYVAASTTVPVLRGKFGTAAVAHPASAAVCHGAAADFDQPARQAITVGSFVRATRIVSYSATGAITLPEAGEDLRVILNGTSALAMTIADPARDLDGCELTIMGNGTAAHTLTFASGLGGEAGNYDVLTFNSGGPVALKFVAVGGYWSLYAGVAITGTVTNLTAGLA